MLKLIRLRATSGRCCSRAISELNPDHPETLVLHQNLGSSLRKQGRLAEALPHYKQAVNSARDAGDRRYHTYLQNLGSLWRELEQFELALDRSDLRRLFDELSILYERWHEHQPDRGYGLTAARWRERRAPNSISEF